MSELIDREETVKQICKMGEMLGGHDRDVVIAIALFVQDDKTAFPTVEAHGEWIPCSERLPEEQGQYYVSGGNKVWICDFLIFSNFKGGWCNNVSNPVVEAWMPLPEPYMKEGEAEC